MGQEKGNHEVVYFLSRYQAIVSYQIKNND